MELSKRLAAVAGLVPDGALLADIGTDHAYLPIFLAESGRIKRAVAVDARPGPLERARRNIERAGLSGRIETRLCDGLLGLCDGEADTVTAAGMGGGLILRILGERPRSLKSVKEFIIQPQSELERVRRTLCGRGFVFSAEDMVEEDGKFYTVMRIEEGEEAPFSACEYRYGRLLLRNRNEVLYRFLLRERKIKEGICGELKRKGGERFLTRIRELKRDIEGIDKALFVYK